MSDETSKAVQDATLQLFHVEGQRDALLGDHPHDLEQLERDAAELEEEHKRITERLVELERERNTVRIRHQTLRTARTGMAISNAEQAIVQARAALQRAESAHAKSERLPLPPEAPAPQAFQTAIETALVQNLEGLQRQKDELDKVGRSHPLLPQAIAAAELELETFRRKQEDAEDEARADRNLEEGGAVPLAHVRAQLGLTPPDTPPAGDTSPPPAAKETP